MGKTKIEWTDFTFNPWWGCQRVSPGCENCYAETFANRLGKKLWGPKSGRRTFGDKHWSEPLKWNRAAAAAGERRRVFCASMADVFEDRRDLDEQRARLWRLIEATPALDWLLLTKRPGNMNRLVPWMYGWPANIWAGCTIENQSAADERIPLLQSVPARVRFLSAEPLLGPIRFHPGDLGCVGRIAESFHNGLIHWVIVGGESGHGARQFDLGWGRSIVAQCQSAGTAVFVKQLGAEPVQSSADASAHGSLFGLRSKKGGDPAEWPADLRVREWPC